ncbi:hypothetical protein [Mangrovimonas sp. DI 80]|uniref:hypothetical protein n=1 Tax=Mangrovimonas sp. DI 80 TaxID=1779330 RepID=UPI00097752A7|nr:hypothetical protein [Mangrovimonas sp. DI 80]OMP30065.1 hypothetical protein BKM32_14400 [Mangrovimonas sp. DI 80]
MSYKIGDKCKTGQEVSSILGQSATAAVIITKDNHLRWEYYANSEIVPDWLLGSLSEFDSLMSLIKLTLKDKSKKETYIRLGKALFASLTTMTEDKLENHFLSIREYIYSKANERARIYYVLTGLISFIIIAVTGSLIYQSLSENNADYADLLFGALFGSFGSFISVVLRNDTLQVDPYSSNTFICFQSLFRLITGLLAGFVLILGIKSQLLLSNYEGNYFLVALASITSGFSERFIPEFIGKLEKQNRIANL